MNALTRGLVGVFLLAASAARSEPMEDVDYVRIDSRPVQASDGRIEVIEFFYYGCGACHRFDPLLREWLKQIPADVDFRRVPALRRTDWIPLARLYFALEALNALPRLHGEVYRAIHELGMGLQNRTEAVEWAQSRQLDERKFEDALMSDSVLLSVQHAHDATIEYGIRSTPSLVVDGRYLTSGALLGDVLQLPRVLDELVEMARRRRAGGNE